MSNLNAIDEALSSIKASDQVLGLLRKLHTEAITEPSYSSHATALDKFVALDPDKCALVYLLLRSIGAHHVVEAGTSFGLSTIYLALAIGQNANVSGKNGRVIATEIETSKASVARQHWQAAGEEVSAWIELREGDIRETLKKDLPSQIDFLLLDIWCPLALPTLQLVHPKLGIGAMVVVDNIDASREGYRDLMTFFDDSRNGYRSTTAPYGGGLLVATRIQT